MPKAARSRVSLPEGAKGRTPARDSAPKHARSPSRFDRARVLAARMPLLAVVGPLALIFVLAALAMPMPTLVPDEPLYQHLARSLADGQGLTWRGEHVSLRSALYPYLISPAWLGASGTAAYAIAKVESVLLMCLVAVPIWLSARELLPRGLALAVVALSLTGTWMAGSASLLTEAVAIPLATACLVTTVQALRRPSSSRLPWIALGFALLAAWARLQLVVFVPIVLAALAVDVARSGRAWRGRLRQLGGPIAVSGGIVVVGALTLLLFGSRALGGYAGIAGYRPSPRDVLHGAGLELLQLAPVSGLLPLTLLAVVAWRPAAWRDEVLGPLVAVLVPAVVLLTLESGYYVGGSGVPWAIQRYMLYVAPLLLLFGVVAFTRVSLIGVRTIAASAAVSLLLVVTPDVTARTEQRALFATADRVDDLLPGTPAGVAAALVAVALFGVALAARTRARARGDGPNVVAAAIAGSLLLVLGLQTATGWAWEHKVSSFAGSRMPRDFNWIDHHRHGPVALLEVTRNWDAFYGLDFFNAGIARYYATQIPVPGTEVQGRVCRWRIPNDGVPWFDPACGPVMHEFFVNDPIAHLTFYSEASSARDRHIGRIVTVRGKPRLKAWVNTPCDRPLAYGAPTTLDRLPEDVPMPCGTQLDAKLWLDAPGTLLVGIRGAPYGQHVATTGEKSYHVTAGVQTTIRVPVRTGRGQVVVDLDWAQRSPDDPAITSVELEQDGRRESLL
jgi:hypothetical protein